MKRIVLNFNPPTDKTENQKSQKFAWLGIFLIVLNCDKKNL